MQHHGWWYVGAALAMRVRSSTQFTLTVSGLSAAGLVGFFTVGASGTGVVGARVDARGSSDAVVSIGDQSALGVVGIMGGNVVGGASLFSSLDEGGIALDVSDSMRSIISVDDGSMVGITHDAIVTWSAAACVLVNASNSTIAMITVSRSSAIGVARGAYVESGYATVFVAQSVGASIGITNGSMIGIGATRKFGIPSASSTSLLGRG